MKKSALTLWLLLATLIPAHGQCSGSFGANQVCGSAGGGAPGPVTVGAGIVSTVSPGSALGVDPKTTSSPSTATALPIIPWNGPQLHQSASPPGYPSTFNGCSHVLLWGDLNQNFCVDWVYLGSRDPSQLQVWNVGGTVNASGSYNDCLQLGLQVPVSSQTLSGSNVLNYTSVPSWMSAAVTSGLAIRVVDPAHPAAIPSNTLVTSVTATTVVLNNNLALTISGGEPVNFSYPACYTHNPTDSLNSIATGLANIVRGTQRRSVAGTGVSVASAGSGCTTGTQTFTVQGGTLATNGGGVAGAATVTATVSGGAISGNVTFTNPGNYSTLPASPATLSGGGCSTAPTLNFAGSDYSTYSAIFLSMTTQYDGFDGFGFWSTAFNNGSAQIGFDWPWATNGGNAITASVAGTVTLATPYGLTLTGQQVQTNAATTSGNATLHFASVPSTVSVGMLITDVNTPSAIPANATVSAIGASAVTMSVNTTGAGVANGDYISFAAPINLDNDPVLAPYRIVNDTSGTARPGIPGDQFFNVQLSGYDAAGNLVSSCGIQNSFYSGVSPNALSVLALGCPSPISGSNNPQQLWVGAGLQTNDGISGNECGAFPGDGNFLLCGYVQTKPTTVAGLPSCSSTTQGAIYSVTDSSVVSIGNPISGGGSTHVQVWCNGSGWIVSAVAGGVANDLIAGAGISITGSGPVTVALVANPSVTTLSVANGATAICVRNSSGICDGSFGEGLGGTVLVNAGAANTVAMRDNSANPIVFFVGAANAGTAQFSNPIVAVGTRPTFSGTCAAASIAGGTFAGTFSASAACMSGGTYTLSFPSGDASFTGWACFASDQTTPTATLAQTSSSTGSCTLKAGGTINNNDVIVWHATGF
jgi:hypothetical protein